MSNDDSRKDLGYDPADAIAVVGMAGRFPQAADLEVFWRNLRDGVESISFFDDDTLRAEGVPDNLLQDEKYVRARGVLENEAMFDASFFDYSPLEASLLDPQHRHFLECAHQALEVAGYDPERYRKPIGVYGGVSQSTYLFQVITSRPELVGQVGSYQVALGTEKDYLTTRASYKLDLTGPSLDVQTACSTSLVAVHLACQSLLAYQCDLALAGGVSIKVPQRTGYRYSEGGLDSSDGHCRAFDAEGDGSVYGSGVGVLALRRLEDALEEGDTIRAVILATAMNNDGLRKVGYTAPSIEGQARVIALAHALAGVDPESIGYVEAHGTGTSLGDPIEIAALTKAFRRRTEKRQFVALGSVKTNIGHLGAAAGAAGLIKTVLSLEHEQIPPSLHYQNPNPKIDFANSPVFVNDQLRPWPRNGQPRRAGVSSFGLGGTNAHMVLEEAPLQAASGPSRPWQLLAVSAKDEGALEQATDNLAQYLGGERRASLADVSFTLLTGRSRFARRRVLVARDAAEARQQLAERDARHLLTQREERRERPVTFLLPGIGDHYPGMAQGLYESEPLFRREVDQAAEMLAPHLGLDLRSVLYPQNGKQAGSQGPDLRRMLRREAGPGSAEGEAAGALAPTRLAQPATFVVELALARLWMSWGVRPQALLGYSLGEYVAATVAGVFSTEDALRVVAERAMMVEALSKGAMLAVPMGEEEAEAAAGGRLSLAAVNAPNMSVLSGPEAAVETVAQELGAQGLACRRLPNTHAFHSRWMEPVAEGLQSLLSSVTLNEPELPFLSNVTGTWIRSEEARDPSYWARHLCRTVRFADGVRALTERPGVLLEVGPGQGLTSLALQQQPAGKEAPPALPSLRHAYDDQDDLAFLLGSLGRLWMAGVLVDWDAFYGEEERRRVPLPTYAFQRRRHWIDRKPGAMQVDLSAEGAEGADLAAAGSAPASAASLPATAAAQVAGHAPASSLAAEDLHPRPELATAFVAPEGNLQAALSTLFSELLGVHPVGAHDSFFELGGHSLLGTQLISRLRDRYGVELPLATLFSGPTVAALEEQLAAAGASTGAQATDAAGPAIETIARGGDLPLSFSQERLWFLWRMEPRNPFYNLPFAADLEGPLEPGALAAAMAALGERHETLRSRFAERNGEPVQRVADEVDLSPRWVDLSRLEAADQAAQRDRIQLAEALRPFDLERGPLLRAVIVRQGPEVHRLLFCIHHIVADAWSFGVLLPELARLYGAAQEGTNAQLAPLPVQYADFAAWQRQRLSGAHLQALQDYWKQQLADLPGTELPTDRPRPAIQTYRGRTLRRHLAPGGPGRLAAFCRERGLSPFMVLLAGFDSLIYRLTGQTDLALGSPVAGRTESATEGLVGLFINTLVLRLDLAGQPTFEQLLQRVKDTALAAYEHQELPFEQLVETVQPARDLSRNPLFQILFNLLNTPQGAVRAGERSVIRAARGEGQTSLFDLTLQLGPRDEDYEAAWEHNSDLFDRSTVQRFASAFERLLGAALETPELALHQLPLMSAAAAHQTQVEWNDSAMGVVEAGTSSSLHELLLDRLQHRGADVVVSSNGSQLSGRDLLLGSQRVQSALQSAGVGRGDLVAVALSPDAYLVPALLGILRCGAAYLPLDTAYPASRLEYMLADSGASLLLYEEAGAASLPSADLPRLGIESTGLREVGAGDDSGLAETVSVPSVATDPQDRAYVLYTSGSTGRPKGVEVPHRAVVNFLASMAHEPGLRAEDVLLSVTTLAFDIAVLELFLPLITGARLHLASQEEAVDGRALLARAEACGATTMQATPSTWRMLLDSGWQGAPRLRVLTGGEALPPDLADQLLSMGLEVWNLYGPTETTVWSAVHQLRPQTNAAPVSIGRPVANTVLRVLDGQLTAQPTGCPGELFIGGLGLTQGYLGRPALTAQRFVPDPWAGMGRSRNESASATMVPEGARLYRTGDLVRTMPDGRLQFLGRIDQQVKLRGHRIELGEVESALVGSPGVAEAAARVWESEAGDARLVAYVVAEQGSLVDEAELRAHLRQQLPEPMLPSAVQVLDKLPLTPNRKIDRKRLPRPEAAQQQFAPARSALEGRIAEIWQRVLDVDKVGRDTSFFDLGGHSLLLAKVQSALCEDLGRDVAIVDLFRYPTVSALAGHLGGEARDHTAQAATGAERAHLRRQTRSSLDTQAGGSIAVVGMAGRFPGAPDLETFWHNLRQGVESITRFSDQELAEAGVPAEALEHPNYVKARGKIEDVDLFDARLFSISPREAELIDPQQRMFLELAWASLESAALNPETFAGNVGVFGGVSVNHYWHNVLTGADPAVAGSIQLLIANDKDFLPTRVSYKLGLKGPSVNVQTACSTSLVAVHLACQALLNGECDAALAGAVCASPEQRAGYFYEEGSIVSPDGHCRAFDAEGNGTVGSNGAGVVVLRRLEDALADGDPIRAVIRGTAINNDGAEKVGFTAPSVPGQAAVIAEAQAVAGVEPASIGYVEAHGTATNLGDPIEVSALSQVFGSELRQSCALGSVKTNIGHLDTAAGVAGLIKTVLALESGEIPPSLHYREANPQIDFANSAFYVNTELGPFPERGGPRRAGVSSFGLGGTNAHAVLEQAPERELESASESASGTSRQLLLLSAKSQGAVGAAAGRLAAHLESHPEQRLADVAYTLERGRRHLEHRLALVVDSAGSATEKLRLIAQPELPEHEQRKAEWQRGERGEQASSVAFLFSGQGSQYPGMGRDLYESEEVFRQHLDRAAQLLQPHLGLDLVDLLYGSGPLAAMDGSVVDPGGREELLQQTRYTQPALFAVEYALAQQWMAWGVRPEAMLGHSIGEYVAACVAGVFSLERALELVATRGRLMQELPSGSMLSVPLAEEQLQPHLETAGGSLSLAAVNAPGRTVVSGPDEALEELQSKLEAEGVACRPLHTSHAFHSAMMDPILEPFRDAVLRAQPAAPEMPFLSNLSGTWIRPEQATDPDYWVQHLRQAVRFAEGVQELLNDPGRVLLEVGPGNALASLAGRHPARQDSHAVVASLRHPKQEENDQEVLLRALGQLWVAGVQPDWQAYWGQQRRRKLVLPTYPFERQRFWIERRSQDGASAVGGKRHDLSSWTYVPTWRQAAPHLVAGDAPGQESSADAPWVLLVQPGELLGEGLAQALVQRGEKVLRAEPGQGWLAEEGRCTLDPEEPSHFVRLMSELDPEQRSQARVVHLWSLPEGPASAESAIGRPYDAGAELRRAEQSQRLGFFPLIYLARAMDEVAEPGDGGMLLQAVSVGMCDVLGEGRMAADQSLLLGPALVLGQEMPGVQCRVVDLADGYLAQLPGLLRELQGSATEAPEGHGPLVALRAGRRWLPDFDALPLASPASPAPGFEEGGRYLITGGLGGLGLTFARHLAQCGGARLLLIGRSELPSRNDWEAWRERFGPEDSISRKIDLVMELEQAGAEVRVVAADVANRAAMAAALAEAREAWGGVDGVIHAAGVAGGGLAQLKSRDDALAVMAAKVQGTLILEELLADEALRFFLVCSSVSSIVGNVGQVDYSAANAFLDAWAQDRAARNAGRTPSGGQAATQYVAVNWDAWRDVGLAVDTATSELLAEDRQALLRRAIAPAEGVEVLRRVLASGLSRVVASTRELGPVLEANRLSSARRHLEELGDRQREVSSHERPELKTEYAPPTNERQERLVELWSELLGMEKVGIHDSFFDLGGDSLLGIQLIARLRESETDEISLEDVFTNPTIAGLDAALEAASADAAAGSEDNTVEEQSQELAAEDDEDLEALLSEIEGLSEDELERELQEPAEGEPA